LQSEGQVRELKSLLKVAEARVAELERRLSNRQAEAHVLKKALDQYKHQIANLTQELDILRGRMKKAGLIKEAHSVLPHSATDGGAGGMGNDSGEDTFTKAFAAEQARMVDSEKDLGFKDTSNDFEDDGARSITNNSARKVVRGTTTDEAASDDHNASSRESLQRAKAEAEANAATQANI
jgi:uncharacterized coiled-coil protein SlyX